MMIYKTNLYVHRWDGAIYYIGTVKNQVAEFQNVSAKEENQHFIMSAICRLTTCRSTICRCLKS
jgi:hypothetical protein